MIAAYNGREVTIVEKTAVLLHGNRLMVDVCECGECSSSTGLNGNQVYFEDLVFQTPAEKRRTRKTIIDSLEAKKVKKISRPTNGCVKKR